MLAAARTTFADAITPVTLEAVADAAGVGIGTLYRHFPTREVLVEAVYRSELDDVIHSAADRPAGSAADTALRDWLDRYARFMVTKRGLHRAGTTTVLATPRTRDQITHVLAVLLEAGTSDGSLRGDVSPDDVVTNLLGIFLATASDSDSARANRLLDLLMDALRSRPTHG